MKGGGGPSTNTHYAAQRESEIDGAGFQFAGCWAHVFRRFRDAAKDFPDQANPVLEMISNLYRVKYELEGEARQKEWGNIISKLFSYLLNLARRPKSSLQDSINYTLNAKKSLILFLTDETIWLDNNLSERSLRGPVIGRKNHYGSKSERGTEVAAIFYSLIETCKHIGINPRKYLNEAVGRAIENPGAIFLPHEMLI